MYWAHCTHKILKQNMYWVDSIYNILKQKCTRPIALIRYWNRKCIRSIAFIRYWHRKCIGPIVLIRYWNRKCIESIAFLKSHCTKQHNNNTSARSAKNAMRTNLGHKYKTTGNTREKMALTKTRRTHKGRAEKKFTTNNRKRTTEDCWPDLTHSRKEIKMNLARCCASLTCQSARRHNGPDNHPITRLVRRSNKHLPARLWEARGFYWC